MEQITAYKTFKPQEYLLFRVLGQKDDVIVYTGDWKQKEKSEKEYLKLWNDNRTIFYFIERGKFLISKNGKAKRI
ncbi:hypothetical protein ES705_29072 [subsurface metagenome]